MTVRRTLTWIGLLLVLAGVAWLGWRGARTAGQARLALADLDRLQALAAAPSLAALPELRDDVAALEGHLIAARAAGGPFLALASRLGWAPRYGPTLAAAPALLDMAVELAGGGRQALDALAPLTDALGGAGGPGAERLAQALPALAAAAPELAQADARLARAQQARAGFDGGLDPRLAAQLARLDRLLPLARTGLQAAQIAPPLLGADGPRTYLLLAQNNHELRGSGGFISAAGTVRVEAGRIVDLALADSYAVDNLEQPHPAAPRPLTEQMGTQLLMLRDSNWSPDFPESAQVARALFEQDRGVATDGAIALDLEAVRLLVAALGPLPVAGVPQPVTGDDVVEWMKQAWQAPQTSSGTVEQAATSDWWVRRKDFMGDLMAAALAKVQAGGFDPAALGRALMALLAERHIQVAVDDPGPARFLAERGWDGGLRPPVGSDFLAVVDSNVGFNKANAAVAQQIAYRVEPAAGGLAATLTLTYTHTAPAGSEPICDRAPRYGDSYDALVHRCYWDYLRVYAPGGSELLAAEGLNRTTAEAGERGATVFAGDFSLQPGDQHVVTLRYRLPAAVPADPYRLTVRKQAGTLAVPLAIAAGACRWATDLGQDRAVACEGGS